MKYFTPEQKKLRIQSALLSFGGLAIWFFSDSTASFAPQFIRAIGIFFFIYGTLSMHSKAEWKNLSQNKKKLKIFALAFVLAFVISFVVSYLFARG